MHRTLAATPVLEDVDLLGCDEVDSNRKVEASLGRTRLFNDRRAARQVSASHGWCYVLHFRPDVLGGAVVVER